MKTGKSIWRRLLVMVVSVAMMIGCIGGVSAAFAAPVSLSEGEAVLHTLGSIQSKVELGNEFTVLEAEQGVKLSVQDPTGKDITQDGNYAYNASVLGNYKVTYSNEDVSYTYIIKCYEDAEYYIEVKGNGSSIPTFIAPNTEFTLPEWHLAKKVDDKVEYVENGVELYYQIDNGEQIKADGKDVKVSISDIGTKMLILSAKFESGNKRYTQKYTVNVQQGFNDENPPTLRSISNMPSTASVNTKVSLPKATADDDYDDNVEVVVEVKDPGGNAVKAVEPNEHGYAPVMDDATYNTLEDAQFDNADNMSFYPTKVGAYTVTYYAKDDAGKESTHHTYKIVVSDRTGPIIIDSDDDLIPTVWGLRSVQNGEDESAEMTLKIPLPQVVDNKDVFNLNTSENPGTGDIKMTVEVKNPDNTVALWSLLTPEQIMKEEHVANATKGSYKKYYKNDVDGVQIVTSEGNPYLRLNFTDFYSDETDDSTGDDNTDKVKAGVTGIWTITFSFRDGANNGGYNNSRKIYSIDVRDLAFIDDEAPVITTPNFPNYLIANAEETTYTVPAIEVKDNFDTRLTESYYIYSGTAPAEEERFYVESGEKLQLGIEGDNAYLKNEDGKKLTVNGSISFAYTAKDDAGNEAVLKDEDNDYSVTVYTAKDGFEVDNVEFDISDDLNDGKIGSFKIGSIAQPEFVGFELIVKDEKGNSLDGVTSNIFYTDEPALYVKDIKFAPAKTGDYEVNIRLFDAKNNSYVFAKKLHAEVKKDTVQHGVKNSAIWNSVGSARKSYTLKNEPLTVSGSEDDKFIRVYSIKGGRFSLLGYEFTPIDLGNYEITEYYGKQDELITATDDFADKITYNAFYNMNVSDENTAKIETDNIIPSYLADLTKEPNNKSQYQAEDNNENAYFYITPHFIAYSDAQNYEVALTYTDPDGNSNGNPQKVYEYTGAIEAEEGTKAYYEKKYSFKASDEYKFYGSYALTLDRDGSYNLEASVKVGENTVRESYTIKVGDIIAPQFTLESSGVRAQVGNTFSYRTFEVVDMNKDNPSDVTVYYSLYEPGSTSSVSEVSGSIKLNKLDSNNGKYSIKLDENYTFASSGDYIVRIILRDKAGNESTASYTITVSSVKSNTPASLTMLSTVLIIVGVLLIIGVVVYLIRFRKRKEN